MYLTGDDFDYEKAKLINSSQIPVNLDDGFDVYATQAFNAPDGKAYAISWVACQIFPILPTRKTGPTV